jgi:hypothetical protein
VNGTAAVLGPEPLSHSPLVCVEEEAGWARGSGNTTRASAIARADLIFIFYLIKGVWVFDIKFMV